MSRLDRRSFILGALKLAAIVSLPVPPLHRFAKQKLNDFVTVEFHTRNVKISVDDAEMWGSVSVTFKDRKTADKWAEKIKKEGHIKINRGAS